ncbi:putative prostatic acid phosphatase [Blattamonas nauphoetae]|uniref:Prostatic acid phosphatase n=1 Tax=Blattamonas nauphoetae TaxID=2049346 RepID=A0ABQ9XTJ4_9EUKA|nr:putative prostatic acid phosphatase [Blattamonas nauphoetae]
MFLHLVVAANFAELVSVTILSRHGQRTQMGETIYYTPDKDLMQGHLTKLGMKQHLILGQRLRKHYSATNIFGDSYSPSRIYARSTNIPRTLQSAVSQLSGYFENGNGPDNSTTIPIQTEVNDEDYILQAYVKCEYVAKSVQAFRGSPQYVKWEEEHKAVFEQATALVGIPINSTNVEQLNSELEFKALDVPLTDIEQQVAKSVSDASTDLWKLAFNISDPRYERGLNGMIFGEFFRSNPAIDLQNHNKPHQRTLHTSQAYENSYNVRLYSAHDTTIFAILHSFKVDITHIPKVASAFIVELHTEKDGAPYFEFYYVVNSTQDASRPLASDMTQLTPKGCDNAKCPVSTFQKAWENQTYLHTNLHTYLANDCGNTQSYVPDPTVIYKGGKTGVVFGFLTVTAMLVIAAMWMIVMTCVEKVKKSKQGTYQKLSDQSETSD